MAQAAVRAGATALGVTALGVTSLGEAVLLFDLGDAPVLVCEGAVLFGPGDAGEPTLRD